MMTPDEMIDRLLDPSVDTDDGILVNELLSEFGDGYPIENLRKLFVPATIGNAAFLVAELPQVVRPLLKEIVALLENEAPGVRGDAISAISQNTTWEDGWAVARLIRALGDPHHFVRWMTCRALRYMESSPLIAGLKHLRAESPGTIFAGFAQSFDAIERRPKYAGDALEQLLRSDDPIARRFGAALSVRPRLFIDPAFVALATATGDAEVVELVREATEMPLPPWAHWVEREQ